ncbi:MAG: TRAP transporter small permease [Pseudomonadota bacterium]
METQSVWLGALRGPVRVAMLVSIAVTLLLCGTAIFNPNVTMGTMVEPEGNALVLGTLVSIALSIVLASLFLSDNKGSIEIDRTGPLDVLSLVLSRIAMIGTIVLVCVMFYEVVLRYVFEAPTLWANELSLWMASFLFLLAGLYAMQQRSHIRIYIIYDMFPFWMKKVADIISVALIWFFAYSLVFGSYNTASSKWERFEKFGTAWDPPLPATLWPGLLILVVLVAIQALANLINDWNDDSTHSPADEIDEVEIENMRRAVEERG